jgi:hypothetical protein
LRKLISITAAIAALGAIALPSLASANAGTSSGINIDPGLVGGYNTVGGIGSSQGNAKNMTTQYKMTYDDPLMGSVSCTGVHKWGTNYGATVTSKFAVGGRDEWTCTSTTGSPLANTTPGQVFDTAWISDYFNIGIGNAGVYANGAGAHITVSPDGMSETGTANYSAAL